MEAMRTRMYEEQNRGRPKGKSNLYEALLRSLVLMASKYDLDVKVLVEAFIEALRKKTSHCGSLRIYCREVNRDSAIFLVANEKKIISQFPIKLELLLNSDVLRSHIQDTPVIDREQRKNDGKKQKIGDLRFGMKGISVKAEITEIPPAKLVLTKWGAQSYVTNVMIADETGKIRLSLWNTTRDKVHLGDEVDIENCYVARFAGECQLRLGRNGILSIANPSPKQASKDNG